MKQLKVGEWKQVGNEAGGREKGRRAETGTTDAALWVLKEGRIRLPSVFPAAQRSKEIQ